jgi:tetratricopeptide (TPR) repeat protein
VSSLEISEEFERAEAALERQNFAAAIEAYKRCLELRLTRLSDKSDDFVQGDAVVIERLADLSTMFGQLDAADALLDGLEGLFDRAGNVLGTLHAVLKRLELSMATGLESQARSCVERLQRWLGPLEDMEITERALERWEQGLPLTGTRPDREVLLVALYKALGEYLSSVGQFSDAIALLQRGLAHARTSESDLAQRYESPLLLEIALAQISGGNTSQAATLLAEIGETAGGRIDEIVVLRRMELEAQLAAMTGDYGRALRRLEEYQSLAGKHGLVRAEMHAAINHAHLLMLVNYTQTAVMTLRSALDRAERLGDRAAVKRAAALMDLARIRGRSLVDGVPLPQTVTQMQRSRRSGVRHEASSGPEASARVVEGATRFLSRFEDCALSLQWVLSNGEMEKARTMLSDMQQRFDITDSPLIHARLGVLTALVGYYSGAVAPALDLIDKTTVALRSMRLVPDLWQALRIKGWCLSRLGDAGERAFQVREEADALLLTITNFLRPIDRPIFLINKWSQKEELLAGQVAELVNARHHTDRSHWTMRWLRRFQLMRRLDVLISEVDRYKQVMARQAVLEEGSESAPIRRPGLLRRLLFGSSRQATIAFLVLPDRVLVALQCRGRFEFAVAAVTRLALRDLVRRWHVALGYGARERDLGQRSDQYEDVAADSLADLSAQFSRVLLLDQVLASLPAGTRSIRFIPDDILHGFPFAALRVGQGHLVERFGVRVDYDVMPASTRGNASRERKAVVAAVSRGADGIPPLPNAAVEGSEVSGLLRDILPKVEVLDSNHADRQALVNAFETARLVHVASHGIFVSDSPDRSGLVLLPTPDRIEVLSLRDLLNLDLRGLNLATLSSCWSADNFVLPGQRVVSLPETLLRAGADNVVASLWPIADDVALPLMTRFYRLLPSKGAADALRQVQLEMLAGALEGCSLPEQTSVRHWAGVTLFGGRDRTRL